MLYYEVKNEPQKGKKESDNQSDECQWTSSFLIGKTGRCRLKCGAVSRDVRRPSKKADRDIVTPSQKLQRVEFYRAGLMLGGLLPHFELELEGWSKNGIVYG
jgi:hypothetical protein